MDRSVLGALLCIGVAGCSSSLDTVAARRGGDAVTQWSLIADYYGAGAANWRTLFIMHEAMHDALNAAQPVYSRWWPAASGEPDPQGANAEVAMASAASVVLTLLHPEHASETRAALEHVLARYADDAGKLAGRQLGAAIGRTAVAHRAQDGPSRLRFFRGEEAPGRWRPTPLGMQTSATNDHAPVLFASASEVPTHPPPSLGSPEYEKGLAETRRLGGTQSTERTPAQTNEAYFWAYQSSQRGFLELAVRLLAAHPAPAGLHGEARVLAELAAAMADSAILTWKAKEQYSFWRPVTAIRAEGDATWTPLVETPAFPEYPSGHATDCYVGAGVLRDAFPGLSGPVVYMSSAHTEPLAGAKLAPPADYGMGQHAQTVPDAPGGSSLTFESLDAVAENCAESRIWAGAHFPAAETESKRMAEIIVHRAVTATVPVATASPTVAAQPPAATRGGALSSQ
jgi:hypothetical protein